MKSRKHKHGNWQSNFASTSLGFISFRYSVFFFISIMLRLCHITCHRIVKGKWREMKKNVSGIHENKVIEKLNVKH